MVHSFFTNLLKTFTMDHKLKFVCDYFQLTRDEVFNKRRTRHYTDARSVLYAIMYEGNLYGLRKVLKDKYNFDIHIHSIRNGMAQAERYYPKVIAEYKAEEARRNRK